MKIVFSEQAWEDYQFWVVNDRKILKRINQLIRGAVKDLFRGVGKPEPLRHLLKGYWSRRINEEHRMVYCVKESQLMLAQLRYHYER